MTGWLVLLTVATFAAGRVSYRWEQHAAAERSFPRFLPGGSVRSHCRLVAPTQPFDQDADGG